MSNVIKKYIMPCRCLPFDIGESINKEVKETFLRYFSKKNYQMISDLGLLHNFSKYILCGVRISEDIDLYIYEFGIGVFSFKDDVFECQNQKYAIDYCKTRKKAYRELLSNTHKFSQLFYEISNDLRFLLKKNLVNKSLRRSASQEWESCGFSYVMSVSYIIDSSTDTFEFKKIDELNKRNLLILLEPGLASMEEAKSLNIKENDDPYNFNIDDFNPKNWLRKGGNGIYISWSAVVVMMKEENEGVMDYMDSMEVDLQAMWMFSYCLYDDISSKKNDKVKVSSLKNRLFKYKRIYSEFEANGDSNLPEYIFNLRDELARTSLIEEQYNRYTEFLDFIIEETESKNIEEQQKFNVLSEILLFVIAYIQIIPSLYSLLSGEHIDINVFSAAIVSVIALLGIILILIKDKI